MNDTTGHRQRLRQRFARHGLRGFQDYEVLELLLTYVIPRKDVKPQAKALLERFGSLAGVFDAPVEEVKTIDGLGDAAAIFLRLLRDINWRYLECEMQDTKILDSPAKVRASLRMALQGRRTECFGALFLNQQHGYMQQEILFEGTVDRTAVFPREVVRRALSLQAKALIVFHNHPGGGEQASQADIDLTRRLADACQAVELRLLDHFLLAGNKVLSFREQGWFTFE